MADTPHVIPVSSAAAALTLRYTVPAGKILILRNIHAMNYHTAAVKVDVSFTVSGVTAVTYYSVSVAAGAALDWSGFLVLPAGSLVYTGVPGGPGSVVDFLISGVLVDV